jgi:GT2 family glycosyltransferase/glycosyltransferase involved in cell wall biosynthesis
MNSTDYKSMQLLVVADFLPDSQTDMGRRLIQILQALRELGHTVTIIARDDKNQQTLAPPIRELGIEVYAGDVERLPALGKDVVGSAWLLNVLLAKKQFDAAILTQNFRCGITVPEHYLYTVRSLSPQTRIIILTEALYGKSAHRRAEITQQLEHREVAKDWLAREEETFRRADLVIVRHANDERWLRGSHPTVSTAIVNNIFFHGENREWNDGKGLLLSLDLVQPGDIDGFGWFLEKIWPAICRTSREIQLLVTGGEQLPLETRQKLSRVKWLDPTERKEIGDARLFIAPLRFGKVSDNFAQMIAQGVPGVMTSYAAEAAGMEAGYGVLPADTAEEFAASVVQLYQDPEKWKAFSARGVQFAEKQFSPKALKDGLNSALKRAHDFKPKAPASPGFSMTRVDSFYGDALSKAARERRGALRLDGHVQLAQELLKAGKHTEALAQLRHVFSWLGESLQYSAPLARLLSVLARCYRQLGDPTSVEACGRQARRCFSNQTPAKAQTISTVKTGTHTPAITLIVPTFNRLRILKKCLAALEAQSFSAKEFEVIVIDDGSSDGTETMMREYQPPFHLQYLRQNNSGTGAARRSGVAHAQGEYLLLMNDDTICDPDLIEQHILRQRELGSERWAVLGNFEYPAEAKRRAFTHFLRTGSFMFPQIDMEAGFPYPYSHFITCNLSIRRQAVVDAGSFDATYKLSEDTELGIRLFEMGYGVLYHPAAHAWHDHLPYAVGNLIRRARVYGEDYFHMFRRHPRVIKEWAMPVNLTGMDHLAAQRIKHYLEVNRGRVEETAAALERWEDVEFEPVQENPAEAAKVMTLFQQAVPAVHWFYLLEKMLETMVRELNLSSPATHNTMAAVAAQVRR